MIEEGLGSSRAPRLSRRALIAGAAAAAGSVAVGLADSPARAAAPPGKARLPWAKRIWGYLDMPDGARLRYSVLLPTATGRHPVALQYTGYDSGSIGGTAYQQGNTWLSEDVDLSLVRAGYAVMGLSMRGTGCSSGTFDLFGPEWGTDGARAVEWASAQPWSTGRVAMYDWSWGGISQLFVAAERPGGLVAIAPGMVVTDPLRDVGAPGGVPNVLFPALWWATIMDSWTFVVEDAAGDGDAEGLTNVARNLTVGQTTSPVTSMVHLFEDAYWAARDLRAATARIDVPVLSMEDWQDEEVGPRGGYYQELLDPETTWYVGTNGQHDIYVNDGFREELIAFLDHFAQGANNGFEQTARVRLWMDTSGPGAPQASDAQLERAKPAWVISQDRLPVSVSPLTWYLAADGSLGREPPTGRQESKATYVAVPGPTVNDGLLGAVTGGPGGPLGEQTWTSARPARGTFLAFTTAPLEQTLTLAGSASLDLWLSSLAPDTDLQVTVTEVRPDGLEQYIQRGWLRASQRAIDTALSTSLRPVHVQTLASVELLVPDAPVLARVEVNKFAHTFRPGSALRIVIDAPSDTGDWAFAALAGGVNTVWCDRDHPSGLVVGVLSNDPAPTGYPAPNSLIGSPCRENFIPL